MADGSFPTLVSKDRLDNAVANPIWVELSDGTNAVGVTGGALDVNIASGSFSVDYSYVDDSAFTIATDKVGAIGLVADETTPDSVDEGDIGIPRMTLDRKQLMVITDATTDSQRLAIDASGRITSNINGTVTIDANSSDVTVDNGAGGAAVNIQDGGNSITVDGSVSITGTVTVDANSSDVTVDNAWAALTGGGTEAGVLRVTIANDSTGLLSVDDNGGSLTVDGTVAVSSVGGTVTISDGGGSITVDGAVTVSATDLDIRNLTLADDAIKISGNSTANGELNPIFVQCVKTVTSGEEIHDYATATPGADSSANNDYTVAGTTFLLRSVIFSASGGMKAEIQTGPLASLATVAVGFIPRQGGTEQLFFDPPVEVPVTSTGTVRVIMYNRQGAAMDVYSTIIGSDI